jgi:hypothetical protein
VIANSGDRHKFLKSPRSVANLPHLTWHELGLKVFKVDACAEQAGLMRAITKSLCESGRAARVARRGGMFRECRAG